MGNGGLGQCSRGGMQSNSGWECTAAPGAMRDAPSHAYISRTTKGAIVAAVESGLTVAGNSAKDTVNCCTEVIILR